MTTFKDMEDNFKNFLVQEQSDAHNARNINTAKYNNIKIWIDMNKYAEPHFFVRISISEAVYSLNDCAKLNGGLGYEERLLIKWFGRMGVKDKLMELWNSAEKSKSSGQSNEK